MLEDLAATFSDDAGVRVRIVDDGSGAAEWEALLEVTTPITTGRTLFLPLLRLGENQGKGGAVYAGWAEPGEADLLAFVDADHSISAGEIARVLKLAEADQQTSAFFGSRIKMLGRRVDRQFKRHLIGRIYATLVSELLDLPVYDSQCGFKIIRRVAYQTIADQLTIRRFAFDVDLLVALVDSGAKVVEVPIDWHETPGGKVHLLRDSWRMFKDVWEIRKKRVGGRR